MEDIDLHQFTSIVSRVLAVEDITTGAQKQDFIVRYRGKLYGDSEEAYDQLAKELQPLGYTPLFRREGDKHVVLIVAGVINPQPSNPWIPVLMFGLTVLSVMFVGALNAYDGPVDGSTTDILLNVVRSIGSGLPFAVSLLAILLAHEFGHYLMGRFHRTHVTLPYFLPVPIPPFGTMGAFIQLKEPPKNKRILLDIGIAGPLAGMIVAIPILLYGLSLSYLAPINPLPGQQLSLEGNSILYLFLKYITFNQLLPAPESFGNLGMIGYWIRYFFTGQPFPFGAVDVMIHPIAFAGWAGLLVTSLNLIPAGQLDGGHLLYGLFGKRARLLLPFILLSLIVLGLVWTGWWLWAGLIFFLGRAYAEPLDQITQLDVRRKLVAAVGLIVFILVFTPVPLVIIG